MYGLLLHTGDLTHLSDPAQFDTLGQVELALASLPVKRMGVSGSSRIFRDLIPVGCGRIVFWRKQGPDKTETLSSLAGD